MGSQREKHLPYFILLDALKEAKECPFCWLEIRETVRYIDSLLSEGATDSSVRSKLKRSRGFCRQHARVLLSRQDALATAIFYRDQVNFFLEFLTEGGSVENFTKQKNQEKWRCGDRCPACDVEAMNLDSHTATLIAWFDDEDMKSAFDASSVLCVFHFLYVTGKTNDRDLRKSITEIQYRKFVALLSELDEFLRKNDYRFMGEGFGDEGDSWIRAVELMAGKMD